MIIIYKCEDCGEVTETLASYHEKPNTQEIWTYEVLGCPFCGGNCKPVIECGICGKYISDDIIKLNDGTYVGKCCYKNVDIEDLIDCWS